MTNFEGEIINNWKTFRQKKKEIDQHRLPYRFWVSWTHQIFQNFLPDKSYNTRGLFMNLHGQSRFSNISIILSSLSSWVFSRSFNSFRAMFSWSQLAESLSGTCKYTMLDMEVTNYTIRRYTLMLHVWLSYTFSVQNIEHLGGKIW